MTPWMNSPSPILSVKTIVKMHGLLEHSMMCVVYSNSTLCDELLPSSFFPKKFQILSARFSGVFSSSGRFSWSSTGIMLNIDCYRENAKYYNSDVLNITLLNDVSKTTGIGHAEVIESCIIRWCNLSWASWSIWSNCCTTFYNLLLNAMSNECKQTHLTNSLAHFP